MPNDPKWRTIARAAKQTIPLVLAVYVHLLTIASGAVDRGTLVNVNSEDLASALDVDCASVDAVLEAMQGRVLDSDKLTGWEKRQVNREDSSTERMKRFREKKVTQSDATKRNVTHVKRNVTADKSREEEIRLETNTSTLASTALAVPAARGLLRGTLPLTGKRTYEVRDDDFARDGPLYPGIDLGQEYRAMKAWLLANPNHQKTPSGIRRFMNNWLSKAQDKAKSGGGNGNRNYSKTGGNVTAAEGAFAILDAREANRADADGMLLSSGSGD
jgi:hypothetical protein